jgi:hypothetical protein
MIPSYFKTSPRVIFGSINFCLPAIFVLIAVIFLSPSTLLAQPGAPDPNGTGAGAAAFTQDLLTKMNRYQKASPAERSSLINDLIETAAQRREQMLSLMEENPGEALRLALPSSTRAAFPSAIQAYIEQEVDIKGTLEVIDEDYDDHSRQVFYLKTAGGQLSLHFAGKRPDHLLTGSMILVKGVQIGNTLALGGGDTTMQQIATAPVPSTLGEQRTLVILVNFQDNPTEPYTIADAQSVIFGETNNFFLENSYKQAWLNGDVVGWFTIPLSSNVCDYRGIATQAQSIAAGAGVNLGAYSHYVYAFPKSPCGWWGLSMVGGSPSQSWINGPFELMVLSHEMGHALGLWHSHALDCATETIGNVMSSTFPPAPGTCYVIEYGHPSDAMGGAYPGHYNAFQKERLGWLNFASAPPITTVTTSGIYVLEAYESASPGPKALKILKSTDPTTGAKTWYYVEARKPVGFDAFLATTESTTGFVSMFQSGVLVSLGTDGGANTSDLLDMSPATDTNIWQWLADAPLLPGQSFCDPDSGLTMTTQWVTATQAAVNVQIGSGPPPSGPRTVTVSTDKPTYTRTQSVSIKAIVRSGSSPVAKTTVNFIVKKSNGALTTGTGTTDANGMAVYKLRLKRQDPAGTYEADASSLSTNGTTQFTVQ